MDIDKIILDITHCPYSQIESILPDNVNKESILMTIEDIINESLSNIKTVESPFLLNVSGIPGSGKTTYSKMLLNGKVSNEPDCTNALYISFDKIMEDERLPFLLETKQFPQHTFERWEPIAKIAGYEMLKRAIEKNVNILFEHSSAIIITDRTNLLTVKKPHIELFNFLLSKNYSVHFRFIFIYDNLARRRVEERAKLTGRIVPANYIEERSSALNQLRPEYQEICTTYKQIEQCELKKLS